MSDECEQQAQQAHYGDEDAMWDAHCVEAG